MQQGCSDGRLELRDMCTLRAACSMEAKEAWFSQQVGHSGNLGTSGNFGGAHLRFLLLSLRLRTLGRSMAGAQRLALSALRCAALRSSAAWTSASGSSQYMLGAGIPGTAGLLVRPEAFAVRYEPPPSAARRCVLLQPGHLLGPGQPACTAELSEISISPFGPSQRGGGAAVAQGNAHFSGDLRFLARQVRRPHPLQQAMQGCTAQYASALAASMIDYPDQ